MRDHHRCAWAQDDALLRAYHDEEWGVPQHDSRVLWETLMLEGFQAGLSWIIVLRKRAAFRKAFAPGNWSAAVSNSSDRRSSMPGCRPSASPTTMRAAASGAA